MRPYIIAFAMAAIATAQDATAPPAWIHSTKDDPLHGASFDVFTLNGRYLTPPSKLSSTRNPEIVLRCSGGKFKDGYIFVGAVVDRGASGASVEKRLDGKVSKEFWAVSNDGQSIFMDPRDPKIGLAKLLWGHWLPHKEGKGELIRQEIYGVTEAFGSDIVMQFDMPEDQSAVLNACTQVRNGRRF